MTADMDYSQQDAVFKEIWEKAPRPVGVQDLYLNLDIPRRSLSTVVWELTREELIEKIGGKRGNYRYRLTPKGEEEAKMRFRIVEEQPASGQSAQHPSLADFDEMSKLLQKTGDFKYLRHFASFLMYDFKLEEKLTRPGASLQKLMDDAIKGYLDINPSKFEREREVLNSILELM